MSELDGDAPPAGEQLHIPRPSLLPVLVTVGITLALVGVTLGIVFIVIGLLIRSQRSCALDPLRAQRDRRAAARPLSGSRRACGCAEARWRAARNGSCLASVAASQ